LNQSSGGVQKQFNEPASLSQYSEENNFFDAWNAGSSVGSSAQMLPINLVIKGKKGNELGWRVRYGQTF